MRDEAWLLEAEIGAIFGLAAGPSRSLAASPGEGVLAVFGWSPRASVLAVREDVRAAAPVCPSRLMGAQQRFAPEEVPEAIRELREGIERLGLVLGATVTGGPSFVFPDALADVCAALPVIVSDMAGVERARALGRPGNWQAGEWAELIAGESGSWAMAVCGNTPVSICHTPVATDDVAEAGVWTREDHRGRGLAPAVTRAWWERERLAGRALFYSTRADNQASRAVARKLGLEPLGWLWTIREWAQGT